MLVFWGVDGFGDDVWGRCLVFFVLVGEWVSKLKMFASILKKCYILMAFVWNLSVV